jgi:hypothetical protein
MNRNSAFIPFVLGKTLQKLGAFSVWLSALPRFGVMLLSSSPRIVLPTLFIWRALLKGTLKQNEKTKQLWC